MNRKPTSRAKYESIMSISRITLLTGIPGYAIIGYPEASPKEGMKGSKVELPHSNKKRRIQC